MNLEGVKRAWSDSAPTRFVLVSVSFTVVGAYLTLMAHAEGDSADVWRGVAVVLFFGSTSLVALGLRFPSVTERAVDAAIAVSGRSSVEVREVRHRGRPQRAIVFESRSSSAAALLGIAVFGTWMVSLGLFVLVELSLEGVAPRFVAFCFVVLVAAGGVATTRTGPTLAVLPEGVLCRAVQGPAFVPWDAFAGVTVSWYSGQRIIGLTVSDPALIEQAAWTRLYNALNRRLVGFDVVLPATGVDETVANRITSTVRRVAAHPERHARIARLEASSDE